MGQDAVTSRRRRRRRKASACRRSRRREESAVENDRSEGDLTLIAGNTWWNTRGSRSGTKRPPRDLSLIDEVHVSLSDWPATSQDRLPAPLDLRSATSIVLDTTFSSLSLFLLSPFYSGPDRPRNRTGIGEAY